MNIQARWVVLALAVLVFGAVSCRKSGVQAARENEGDLTDQAIVSLDDQKFLFSAEEVEVRELGLAQQALQKSQNTDVLEFARRVVDERKAALSELKRLMQTKQIQEPPGKEEDIQLEAANRLSRVSTAALDHEFVSLMAADLQDAVANFDSASQTSQDPDIRRYAGTVLPSLRTDYVTAADLEKRLR